MDTQTSRWQVAFFAIWTGQAISRLGSTAASFALVWWLTKLTGSATVLATVTLSAVIPRVFLGPIAGAYVDRWNRRWVMIVADSLIALVSLGVVYLFWADVMQVWHIYAMVLARTVGSIFHGPAMSASTSLMVPDEHLARVSGLNQALDGALKILGPPMGALALGMMPLHGVMLLDVGTALLAVVPLFFVHIPQPRRALPSEDAEGAKPTIWADLREGLRFIWGWKGLLTLMAMAAICNFVVNPVFSLLPLFVSQHFQGEAMHLGWLQSAQGIGFIAGGLLLSVWGGFRRRTHTSLTGLILQGLTITLVGMTPSTAFWMAVANWGLGAFMNVFYSGPVAALLQAVVPPDMQGRVFTAMQSIVWIAWPLSLAIAGPVADWAGIRTWYVVGGVVCMVLGIGALLVPAIINMEQEASARVGRQTEALRVV